MLPGERIDDLQCRGYRLIQRPDAFRFGTDSVLLADFADPKRGCRAADLGCGTGAIATLMVAHQPEILVDAVEIQPDIADMALRSVEMNGLTDRIRVHNLDLRHAADTLGHGRHALVVCNPPYGREGAALKSIAQTHRLARHEGDLTPEALCRAAAQLLKNGGRFKVIYPAGRGYEMMRAMDTAGLAPKNIRTVHGFSGRAPKFLLIDAVKGGGSQLHWLPPLVLYEPDGFPTAEWLRIYRVERTNPDDRSLPDEKNPDSPSE